MPADPTAALEAALSRALDNRASLSRLRALSLPPPHAVDFSSNDFLSLSASPLLRAALLSELSRHPAHPLGSGGSRLLDGNSPYAESLEALIAAHHRAPAGLLFNSGFDANAGLFACVPQPGDTVLHDELIHASVHEGLRACRAARVQPFAHNSVGALRAALAALPPGGNVFVAVESLYSMDGDVAPLAEMLDAADAARDGGVLFVVDEAHATGVVGAGGRGLVAELGLEARVFARLHTFGKALACNGAILLTTPLTRQYLINYARPLIYTTALSFPALAAIRASYSLLQSPHAASLQARLRALTAHLHGLLAAAVPAAPQTLTLPPVRATPIVALRTPHPRSLASHLQGQGLVARPIVFPTVPRGAERVRVCVHAGNTPAEVEALVDAVRAWVVARERGSRI